ncbi:uncharacterized protein L203_103022 [Cryptococcus depauperatus CBS 7841]|uniref:Uncharacterized protein n=1 Tax=Cryptococcus depauperatus CBS 7841 TaxID=1295531 RepID=A0AAJ8M1P1_9TREE
MATVANEVCAMERNVEGKDMPGIGIVFPASPPSAFKGGERLASHLLKRGGDRIRRDSPLDDGMLTMKCGGNGSDRARNVTPSGLAPLLYNNAFSNTVLLIGTLEKDAAIDSLLSPSHLLSASSDRVIYPILETFQPVSKGDGPQVLSDLLKQAVRIAGRYRLRKRPVRSESRQSLPRSTSLESTPTSLGGRRNSMFGLNIMSGSKKSLSAITRQSSLRSRSESRPNIAKNMSSKSLQALSELSSRKPRSRLSLDRDSALSLATRKPDSALRVANDSHLFDAVINFVPSLASSSDSRLKQQQGIKDMLNQASVTTTGVIPLIGRTLGKTRDTERAALPVTFLHVVPQTWPSFLLALESFILSLLPNYQTCGNQELFGCIVTTPVWQCPLVSTSTTLVPVNSYSGAEVLLLGGVRCPSYAGRNSGLRPRASLYSWEACVTISGMIAESRRPSHSPKLCLTTLPKSNGVEAEDCNVQHCTPSNAETFSSRLHVLPNAEISNFETSGVTSRSLSSVVNTSLSPNKPQTQRNSKLSLLATAATNSVKTPSTADFDPRSHASDPAIQITFADTSATSNNNVNRGSGMVMPPEEKIERKAKKTSLMDNTKDLQICITMDIDFYIRSRHICFISKFTRVISAYSCLTICA